MTKDPESRENIENADLKNDNKGIIIEFVKAQCFKQIYAIGAAGRA